MTASSTPPRRRSLQFEFHPLREQDLPMLRSWLLRAHVAQWWGPAESIERLRDDYVVDVGGRNATRAYIAALANQPVGFIQCYVVMHSGEGWWEGETDPGARGIDQFLADAAQLGQGIGRAMVRSFIERLFADPAITVVQTDPDPTNERAVRCYVAVGFRGVGPITTPDGDALLMRCTRESLAQSARRAA